MDKFGELVFIGSVGVSHPRSLIPDGRARSAPTNCPSVRNCEPLLLVILDGSLEILATFSEKLVTNGSSQWLRLYGKNELSPNLANPCLSDAGKGILPMIALITLLSSVLSGMLLRGGGQLIGMVEDNKLNTSVTSREARELAVPVFGG